jgi:hypothetical protein
MWVTVIATAAAVCLSMVSLATNLKERGVANPPLVQHSLEAPKTS